MIVHANWFAICFPGGRISSRRHDGSNEGCCRAARPWHAFATGRCNKGLLAKYCVCKQILSNDRAQWKDGELSSRLCDVWGSSVGDRDKHIRTFMLNLNWTVQTVYPNDCWLTDKSTLKYIESFGQSLRIQNLPGEPLVKKCWWCGRSWHKSSHCTYQVHPSTLEL